MGIAGPVHTKDVIFLAYAKKKFLASGFTSWLCSPTGCVQYSFLCWLNLQVPAQYMGLMDV